MVILTELTRYLDTLLEITQFSDYCPNGLQVEGRDTVYKIVTGVTASRALIQAAAEQRADALLVHHGFFWKGENPCIVGMKANRVRDLLCYNINLLAYHLPLDAHPTFGNNVMLAEKLNIRLTGTLETGHKPAIAFVGELAEPVSGAVFAETISTKLDRKPLHIAGSKRPITKIAWCTGAAQQFIQQAALAQCDAFISGEVSESTFHFAQENDIHYFAAGHHATERYGIQALGAHLAQQFDVEHQFIDIPNPV